MWSRTSNTLHHCTTWNNKNGTYLPWTFIHVLSRATPIGTPEDRSTSAIFFFTNELTKKRIQNLTTTMSGEICKKIARRSKWVQLLNKNKLKIKISKKQKEDLISWAKGTTVSQNIVHKIIEDTSWRKSNSLNF